MFVKVAEKWIQLSPFLPSQDITCLNQQRENEFEKKRWSQNSSFVPSDLERSLFFLSINYLLLTIKNLYTI